MTPIGSATSGLVDPTVVDVGRSQLVAPLIVETALREEPAAEPLVEGELDRVVVEVAVRDVVEPGVALIGNRCRDIEHVEDLTGVVGHDAGRHGQLTVPGRHEGHVIERHELPLHLANVGHTGGRFAPELVLQRGADLVRVRRFQIRVDRGRGAADPESFGAQFLRPVVAAVPVGVVEVVLGVVGAARVG